MRKARIVGGFHQRAACRLQVEGTMGSSHQCHGKKACMHGRQLYGGAVGARFVITALHCVNMAPALCPEKMELIRPSSITIVIPEITAPIYGVEQVIPLTRDHEDDASTNRSDTINDMVVLKVRPKFEFNEFVRPACLSNATMSTHLKSVSPLPLKYWPGKHVLETASYGLHLNDYNTIMDDDLLRMEHFTPHDRNKCLKLLEKDGVNFQFSCLESKSSGLQHGDSGSGITANRFGFSYLMAVVSRGTPTTSKADTDVVAIVDQVAMYCQKISTATGKIVNCESPEVVTKAHKLLIDCPQKIYHLFRSIGSSSEQEEEEEVVLHPADDEAQTAERPDFRAKRDMIAQHDKGQYLLLVKSGEAVESSSGVDGQATTNFLSVSPLAAASEMKKTTGNGDGLDVIFPLAVKFTSEGDDHVSGSPRQSAAAEGAASKDFVPLGTGTALFENTLADAESALEMEPDNVKGRCRRGSALRELGRYADALGEFRWCVERDPKNQQFQQLYDDCQMLSDANNFVEMKMEIVGYKDPAKKKKAMRLHLVDGLPSLMNVQHKALSFESLTELAHYLQHNVKRAPVSILIASSTVDSELINFLRSWEPSMLTPGVVEFFSVSCSRDNFERLFGGDLLRPMLVWFSAMENTEYDLSAAIRSLPAIAGLQALSLQRASSFADFERLQQVVRSKDFVDVDAVLGFLHQAPHPAIPAHRRASTTFHCRQQQQNSSAEFFTNRNLTMAMMRSVAGRTVLLDLHLVGAGKLDELVKQCVQRFKSAKSPVSYMLQIRFLGLGSPGADHRDIAALMPIVQSDGPLVLRNGATDEQLLLRATLAPFEEAACLPSGEANGQVMVLEISRVRTGATATVP